MKKPKTCGSRSGFKTRCQRDLGHKGVHRWHGYILGGIPVKDEWKQKKGRKL